MDTHTCNDCQKELPLDAFPFNKKYQRPEAKCRACVNLRRRKGQPPKKVVTDNPDGTRDCGECGKAFEPCQFIKNKEYDCESCASEKRRRYKEANADKVRAANLAYKRRARIKKTLAKVRELRELLAESDDTLIFIHRQMRADIERELSTRLDFLSEATAEEIAEAEAWQKQGRNLTPKVEEWVRRAVKALDRRIAARSPEEQEAAQARLEELLKDLPVDDLKGMLRDERKANMRAADRRRLGY